MTDRYIARPHRISDHLLLRVQVGYRMHSFGVYQRYACTLVYVGAGDGALAAKLAKPVKVRAVTKVTLLIGTGTHKCWRRRCRACRPTRVARTRQTTSTCFAISSVRRPTLALGARGACVLGTHALTGSASALADNRSWPPREPQAKPQVTRSLQTSAMIPLRDQRPRLPRYRRKVR